MANQHTSDFWSQNDNAERALDLRVNYGLPYTAIADILGCDTEAQPRSKVSKMLRAGVETPTRGRFTYPSWALRYSEELLVESGADPLGTSEQEAVAGGEDTSASNDALGYHVEVEHPFARHRYRFDGKDYSFSVNDELVSFPKELWEAAVRDYSGQGGNLTCYEVAAKYSIPVKVLEKCFSLYAHFKARPPVTREALAEAVVKGEMTPLMQQAIEAQEHKFGVKLEQQRVRQMEARLRELEQERLEQGELADAMRSLVQELVTSFGGFAARTVEKAPFPSGKVYDIHAPLFDLHAGLSQLKALGWSQRDYNSDTALRMVRQHGRSVANLIRQRHGTCRVAYLTHGGDTFHAPFGRTEHGRPLQRDTPDRLLMRELVQAFIVQIDAVRPHVEKVVVKGVEGNHGHLLDALILDFLALYYKDAADVEVSEDLNQRTYFRVGETLHVLDHGTKFGNVTSTASMAFAERISRVVAGEDFHGATRIYFYVGHLHHRENATNSQEKSQAHLNILRVPTICSANDYETFLGFYNESMTDVYFLDARGRIFATERLYMMEELSPVRAAA